jgi:hypothetical protein
MEPTAEQLIRDYLDRLSVAARTRLRSNDRRAFLERTREFIERRAGAPGAADPDAVLEALSSLGEPEAAAESEQARLVAERSKRAGARAGLWRPRSRGDAPDAEAQPDSGAASESDPAAPAPDPRDAGAARPSQAPAPRAGVDVSHLTGRELKGDIEKKVKVNRPLTSRWRPGEPLKQQPSRPYRIPRHRVAGSRPAEVNGVEPSGSGTSTQRRDSKTPGAQPTASTAPGPRTVGPQAVGSPPADSQSAGSLAPDQGAAGPTSSPHAPAPVGLTPTVPPEVSSPGPARPGAASPGAGPGTTSSAAPLADGAPAPATRAVTFRRPRLPSARLAQRPGVTRDRVRRLVRFWGRRRLEATAVILMALAGLVYPFPIWVLGFSLWLLGAIVAAASKQWSPWEKYAGILGPVVLIIAGTSAGLALGGQRHSMAAYAHEVLADSRYMIQIACVLGAVYLAWRAHRAYRGGRLDVPPWNRHHRI